jgi:amino-acid N-acetyltransferase
MTNPEVRRGTARDRPAVLELLKQAGLPTADLADAATVEFWVADDEGRIAGAIGLERFGADALLRSLVVAPGYRNRGLGIELVAALEREARAAGVRTLVLLTQTAEKFFARLGFAAIDRAAAPAPVQASAEFRSLCPSCAFTMIKAELPVAAP